MNIKTLEKANNLKAQIDQFENFRNKIYFENIESFICRYSPKIIIEYINPGESFDHASVPYRVMEKLMPLIKEHFIKEYEVLKDEFENLKCD
jgi:hypothetical protein